ncbi:response regulator transcription factor [Pseudomonas fontis]|uniref:Response regulator transcription factor n=1 Tax=Pseudomonas fontis TaxID=2942633 RepID=A0ABT5NQ35_9PSED|nr:response regulator transcription factor [Pseudomonas fontis]MDD0972834.1 response regulator transcription factor [Pseudomonas fontis]MDD0990291.1 response regulator transcription factor [Pseudomonas fontis]
MRVLLADDHPVIHLALRPMLEAAGYHVVGQCYSGLEVLRKTAELKPDVLVLDIDLPELSGLQVMAQLKASPYTPRVLVFTAAGGSVVASQCLVAGVNGFVGKDACAATFMRALRAVAGGSHSFPLGVLSSVRRTEALSGDELVAASLTRQEVSVLWQLAQGRRGTEIAADLGLSPKTVSTYKSRLMVKTGATSLIGLVDFARRVAIN